MRRPRPFPWWLAGVLAVILGVVGIAVATSAPPPGGEVEVDPELAATGAAAQLVSEPTTTTPAPAATTVPASATVLTTKPAPPTTPPTAAPVSTSLPVASTLAPLPTTSIVTTTTSAPRRAPSSWSLDDKAISLRLWIEPALPRVGDTVTFTFEAWATVPTDFCCINHVYVGGEMIYMRFHDQGPCPLAPSERRQQATFVVTEPGEMSFQLQSSRLDLCKAPPQFTTNNLHASMTVLP